MNTTSPLGHSGIRWDLHPFKQTLLNEQKITALTMRSCMNIFSEGTTRPVSDIWDPKCSPQVSSSKRASLFLLIELSLTSFKCLFSKEFRNQRQNCNFPNYPETGFLFVCFRIPDLFLITNGFSPAQKNHRATVPIWDWQGWERLPGQHVAQQNGPLSQTDQGLTPSANIS